ncbi:hypothetical protein GCM10025857_32790 [Alicyclobacillus contaminans]|nr:hypothetical protein GCM10025857_32790 [Alicyclobacillus contaminans]
MWTAQGVVVARADVPSIADFGQTADVPAFDRAGGHTRQAAFVTLYPDGRCSVQIRSIADDTVNAFWTESAAWRMDHGLTWFTEMPVYVKEISPPPRNPAEDAV